MATKIKIKHEKSAMIKDGYYGFSWTYFFFGWLVPLFRGELGVGALHLLFTIVTLGIWQIFLCFLYNKQYMTRMLTAGWKIVGNEQEIGNAKVALGIETSYEIDQY
tara:strand:- start:235 stop:552 length:318 start_codon:yes stop_codon:yes gene_type:complete